MTRLYSDQTGDPGIPPPSQHPPSQHPPGSLPGSVIDPRLQVCISFVFRRLNFDIPWPRPSCNQPQITRRHHLTCHHIHLPSLSPIPWHTRGSYHPLNLHPVYCPRAHPHAGPSLNGPVRHLQAVCPKQSVTVSLWKPSGGATTALRWKHL